MGSDAGQAGSSGMVKSGRLWRPPRRLHAVFGCAAAFGSTLHVARTCTAGGATSGSLP